MKLMENDNQWALIVCPALGALLALLCLYFSLRAAKRRRLVQNLPTSKTTGVFIGLVELKGSAEAEAPLVSFLAEQNCVHYTWSVEEHWSRTVTETYRDSKGVMRTRRRRESGWKTVANGGELIPFYLKDDCGAIRVDPDQAKIEPVEVFDVTCFPSEPLYYAKGPAFAVAHSDHRRRFQERAIPLHAPIYVMGQARERGDVVAPEIAHDTNAPMFLVSTRTEEAVSSSLRWNSWGLGLLGLALCVGGFLVRDAVLERDMPGFISTYLLAAVGYVGAWLIGWRRARRDETGNSHDRRRLRTRASSGDVCAVSLLDDDAEDDSLRSCGRAALT